MADDGLDASELADALEAIDATLGVWNRELSDRMQEQIRAGTPAGDAVQAMIARHKQQVEEDRAPVDYDELHARIVELCDAFRDLDNAGRAALRERAAQWRNLRNQFYGFIHYAAARLRATRDGRWIDLALAAAAIDGGLSDWRDLYVALGELWLAAESVHINPRSRFEAAAAMADDTLDATRHSPRGLVAGFPHSAHLHSIKYRR